MSRLFLWLYGILHILLLPLYCLYLLLRYTKGKENSTSLRQRFAISQAKTPPGKTKVWMHAASIGEANLALSFICLINEHSKDSFVFVITTGTVASGKVLAANMPDNCVHQFQPIDNPIFVLMFLLYHRPNLGIFVEEEFWPCLINIAAKFCPLMLINGRMSNKSFAYWQQYSFLFQLMIGKFSKILLQSESDLEKYNKLGVSRVKNLGNLKFATKQIPCDIQKADSLQAAIGHDKFIVVAASTHKEDEEALLEYARQIDAKKTLLVLVLRHPERVREVKELLDSQAISFSTRSEAASPRKNDQVYIVDGFGELGLFYKIAKVSFIGGSFGRLGGHNLLEAAHFALPIIVGPDMSNFENITDEMRKQNAVIQVSSAAELARVIIGLQSSSKKVNLKNYGKQAKNYILTKNKIGHSYLQEFSEAICNEDKK